MKNFKRLFCKCAIACMLSVLMLASTGCNRAAQAQPQSDNSNSDIYTLTSSLVNFDLLKLDIDFSELDLPSDIMKSAIALLDDSIIFVNYDTPVVYYRYYFSSGEFVEIGSIDNVAITLSHYEVVGDVIFAYTTVSDVLDYQSLTNVLFGIDLQNNKLLRLSEESMLPRASGFYHQGSIVSLQSNFEDDILTSYLYRFDLETNTSSAEMESFIDTTTDTDTGVLKVILTTDENFVYVLYLYLYGSESPDGIWSEAFIRVYDKDMAHVRDISIGEVSRLFDEDMNPIRDLDFDKIGNFIFSSNPSILRVFGGEYVYILNASFRSLIGRIEQDGSISPLHKGSLELSRTRNIDAQGNTQLFFERFTNNVALLDTYSGLFHELEIDFEEGYVIRYIRTNGNVALVRTTTNNVGDDRYYLTTFAFE